MTIDTLVRSHDYVGNGATDTYSFNFHVLDVFHLVLTKTEPITLIETVLAYPADFSVTGIRNPAGGTITLAAGNLPTDWGLRIERSVPFLQLTDLRNSGGYYPETVEEGLDYLMMAIQQLGEADVTVIAADVDILKTNVNDIDARVTVLENDNYKDVPRSVTVSGVIPIGARGACVAATGNVEIPANIFAVGHTFNIANATANPITITQGSGLTLHNSGTANTGNRTLAGWGITNVWFISATEAYIAGPGLT